MARFILLLAALTCGTATVQSFDVVSVKMIPRDRSDGFSYVKIASPGRLVARNASLHECITWAYQLKDYQLFGPAWLESGPADYAIEAKAREGTTGEQMRLMFQTLLRERFGLVIHREIRRMPVYLITTGKKKPRLAPASTPPTGLWSRGGADQVHVTGDSATMAQLADRLARDLDRPVFDRTGIAGAFRIDLQWAQMGDGPSLFAVIEEQLGLKLQPSKMPIEVVVVDHAEPTPQAN